MKEPWFNPGAIVRIKGRKGTFKLLEVHSYTTKCGEHHWGMVCSIPHGPHITVYQEDTHEFRTV